MTLLNQPEVPREYHVWVNAYKYEGFREGDPQWKGYASNPYAASLSAARWWMSNHGVSTCNINEPLCTRVVVPGSLLPPVFYAVKFKLECVASLMVEEESVV